MKIELAYIDTTDKGEVNWFDVVRPSYLSWLLVIN
jgi:hypothetical protein